MIDRRLAVLCMLSGLPAAAAPVTAQKVVDEYLRAMGGSKAITRVTNAAIAGSLTEAASGSSGSFSVFTKAPNRYYSEIIIGSDRVIEAYNGMSAWGQDAGDAPRTLTAGAAKEAEAAGRYRNGALADVKKSKLVLDLLPLEKVRGRDAYHVRVRLSPSIAREVYFDAQTHLIVRESGGAQQFDYDDYRPVSGIPTPHRIELRRGGHEYTIAVTRAEYNGSLDASVFDFPKAGAAPAPDIKALILEVTRNQHAIEEMMKQYTCHLTVEEEKVDSKGQAATKTVKEFEVFYVAGEEVRRLIARDGKPLAGDEKKKEDERFNKEFEKLQKHAAEMASDPKKQKKQDEKEEAQISDFLRVLRFSNARRERFRGQEVIAVDFGPNPEYKPKKAIEGAVQKLAGVVWIDEKARDVARLEAHFSDAVKIGLGLLASLEKGSNFVFEQAKVNDEVWLPSYTEVHMTGRVLVVKLRAHEIDRYSDYKKFSAESRIVGVKQEE